MCNLTSLIPLISVLTPRLTPNDAKKLPGRRPVVLLSSVARVSATDSLRQFARHRRKTQTCDTTKLSNLRCSSEAETGRASIVFALLPNVRFEAVEHLFEDDHVPGKKQSGVQNIGGYMLGFRHFRCGGKGLAAEHQGFLSNVFEYARPYAD